MIASFRDRTTEDIYNGDDTKVARKVPTAIWRVAFRKLDMVNSAHELKDLLSPPANRLEELKGSLRGFHSIRINQQFRIVFRWREGNAYDVYITDYH